MFRSSPHCVGFIVSALLVAAPLPGCDKDVDAAGRVMRPVMSPDFAEPIARVPLPAEWKFETNHAPGEPSAVGPDGIRVSEGQGTQI
jgi:hypothetical protein